jgi:hypothetical protein
MHVKKSSQPERCSLRVSSLSSAIRTIKLYDSLVRTDSYSVCQQVGRTREVPSLSLFVQKS